MIFCLTVDIVRAYAARKRAAAGHQGAACARHAVMPLPRVAARSRLVFMLHGVGM